MFFQGITCVSLLSAEFALLLARLFRRGIQRRAVQRRGESIVQGLIMRSRPDRQREVPIAMIERDPGPLPARIGIRRSAKVEE